MVNKLHFGEFGRVLIRFASAQVVSTFLRLVSGFLVVKFLEPELYGQFTGIGIYMGYILLGHGGIINGLGRELPYELGRKNDQFAKEMASSVYALSSVISILAALFFFISGLIHFISGDRVTALIYMAYVLIGGFNLLNKQYLPVLYRTNKDFDSLSKQNIFVGIGNLFSVFLVFFFNIYGLLIRGVFLALLEFYLLFKNKPYEISFSWNVEHFKKLFKTGLPIFMVGQVNSLWYTVMNTFIFSLGGGFSFGLYALSTIIQNAFGVIPNAFGQVIYPKMSIMLGEGKSISHILKVNVKPLFFQFGLMLTIAIVGAILLPVIIPIILPKYVDGIVAAQWMLFTPAMQSFGALNNIFNVIKRQKLYFFSLITGALIGSLFILFKIRSTGFYLEIFPQGLLLGTAVQQILSIIFVRNLRNT
jgi:O-antigen/teichoic acid export membrane protein